jgi:hypothetical protein
LVMIGSFAGLAERIDEEDRRSASGFCQNKRAIWPRRLRDQMTPLLPNDQIK